MTDDATARAEHAASFQDDRALWDAWTALHATGDFYDLEGFRRGGVRRGRGPTGADFSPAAVRLASELAMDLGFPEARFVESNLYELPQRLDGTFDVVYTSRGVLGWLPDIRGWARVVAHFVKPGGVFYISEIHPVVAASASRRARRASSR